jgi:hypothetical protein
MSKQELMVECIPRAGFNDLYIGYADGACQTFYTLQELTEWFASKGVPEDDELWAELHKLQD